MRTRPDLLLPDEAVALRNADSGFWFREWIVAVVGLLLGALPFLIYLSDDGRVDHLLGRAEAVTAEVETVQVVGGCTWSRSGSDREYRVEVSWTADGMPNRGSYKQCESARTEGETIRVWVGPSGHISNSPPAHDRLGLAFLGGFLGIVAWGVGAATIVIPRRRRRRVLAAGSGEFSSTVPVELRRGRKGRLRMRLMAPTPELNASDVKVEPVLYTRVGYGSTTRTSHTMTGTWSLRFASINGLRRRIGLLERDQERWWIEFSARRW